MPCSPLSLYTYISIYHCVFALCFSVFKTDRDTDCVFLCLEVTALCLPSRIPPSPPRRCCVRGLDAPKYPEILARDAAAPLPGDDRLRRLHPQLDPDFALGNVSVGCACAESDGKDTRVWCTRTLTATPTIHSIHPTPTHPYTRHSSPRRRSRSHLFTLHTTQLHRGAANAEP